MRQWRSFQWSCNHHPLTHRSFSSCWSTPKRLKFACTIPPEAAASCLVCSYCIKAERKSTITLFHKGVQVPLHTAASKPEDVCSISWPGNINFIKPASDYLVYIANIINIFSYYFSVFFIWERRSSSWPPTSLQLDVILVLRKYLLNN